MWYLILHSWCPWILLYFALTVCGLAFYGRVCVTAAQWPHKGWNSCQLRGGTARGFSEPLLTTNTASNKMADGFISSVWKVFSHFEIKMFWRVCFGLLMNISSPVDGTHWGMPRKQPYHDSPTRCVQVVWVSGEKRSFPTWFSCCLVWFTMWNNWMLTCSLQLWYIRETLNESNICLVNI